MEVTDLKEIDIHSGSAFPSGTLSNLAEHHFVFQGVKCKSIEGFLQGLKFKDVEIQNMICQLSGLEAKRSGKLENDWVKSKYTVLYWRGKGFRRDSIEYQNLLDDAYETLATVEEFKRALLFTGDAKLTHHIGNPNPKETILTPNEMCGRLTDIRTRLQKETNNVI